MGPRPRQRHDARHPGRGGERPRAFTSADDEGHGGPGRVDAGNLYWTYRGDNFTWLLRLPLRGRRCRAQVFGGTESVVVGIPTLHDYAVDRGRIYYATGSGVYKVDPARLRWAKSIYRWC